MTLSIDATNLKAGENEILKSYFERNPNDYYLAISKNFKTVVDGQKVNFYVVYPLVRYTTLKFQKQVIGVQSLIKIGSGGFSNVFPILGVLENYEHYREKSGEKSRVIKLPKRNDLTPEESEQIVYHESFISPPHLKVTAPIPLSRNNYALLIKTLAGTPLIDILENPSPLNVDESLTRLGNLIHSLWEQAQLFGIVHGDLKPENVFEKNRALTLLDYGLARTKKAGAKKIGGSLDYTAPEVFLTQSPPGYKADVYTASLIGGLFFHSYEFLVTFMEMSMAAKISAIKEYGKNATFNISIPDNLPLQEALIEFFHQMSVCDTKLRYSLYQITAAFVKLPFPESYTPPNFALLDEDKRAAEFLHQRCFEIINQLAYGHYEDDELIAFLKACKKEVQAARSNYELLTELKEKLKITAKCLKLLPLLTLDEEVRCAQTRTIYENFANYCRLKNIGCLLDTINLDKITYFKAITSLAKNPENPLMQPVKDLDFDVEILQQYKVVCENKNVEPDENKKPDKKPHSRRFARAMQFFHHRIRNTPPPNSALYKPS